MLHTSSIEIKFKKRGLARKCYQQKISLLTSTWVGWTKFWTARCCSSCCGYSPVSKWGNVCKQTTPLVRWWLSVAICQIHLKIWSAGDCGRCCHAVGLSLESKWLGSKLLNLSQSKILHHNRMKYESQLELTAKQFQMKFICYISFSDYCCYLSAVIHQ